MAKRFNDNYSRRVVFAKSKQKIFLDATRTELGLTSSDMANILGISVRTLNDWKREKFSMSEAAVRKLCQESHLKIPPKTEFRSAFWFASKAAKLGGAATIKKYGAICTDPEKRKKGWAKWWQTKGRFQKRSVTAPRLIHLPRRSINLAEFMGIMIGDGGITDYQLTITLNSKDDREYAAFVVDLIKKLFRIKAAENYRESVVNIVISRKNLVTYLLKLGLKKGNKIRQGVDIPKWVKQKSSYALACVKGLIDTDGSFYRHRYQSKNKWYMYQKIAFTSKSTALIQSVKEILESINLHPKINSRGDIRLYRTNDVKQYYKIIGSHNPKHIRKYQARYVEREPAGTAEVC